MLKAFSLRRSQNLCICLFTWKQRPIQEFSQAVRGTSKKKCSCIRTLLQSLKLGDRSMINVQFPISTRLLPAYFLIWKPGRTLNPWLVIFIYLLIYSSFKVDLYLAYKLRNTVELTYRMLLQNLSLKSLFPLKSLFT